MCRGLYPLTRVSHWETEKAGISRKAKAYKHEPEDLQDVCFILICKKNCGKTAVTTLFVVAVFCFLGRKFYEKRCVEKENL